MASRPRHGGTQMNDAARQQRNAEAAAREVDLAEEQVSHSGASLAHALARPGQASAASILSLGRAAGNRAVSRHIQARLIVGAAGDRYEQEADRIAERVLSMPAPAPPGSARAMGAVQRQADEEEEIQTKPLAASISPLVQRQGEEEEYLLRAELLQRQGEEEDLLQAKRSGRDLSGSFEAGHYLESRLAANRGGGRPLPVDARAFMEPRFGADFSGVRLHTGGEATQLNDQLQSRAFTHGSDIYLRRGYDDVTTPSGRQLLAHELTHVVQQRSGSLAPKRASRLPAAPGPDRLQRATSPSLAWPRRLLLGTSRKPTGSAGREGSGAVPTGARQGASASSPRGRLGRIGQGLAKAGAGVLEGVATTLLGPLTYLRYLSAKQRKAFVEDTVKADYGHGKIAVAAKTLGSLTKAIEEVGVVAAWVGLVAAIVGAALGAASFGAAAGVGGTIATICGYIALACAGWSFIARSILAIGNIVRLGKYYGWASKEIKVQIFKDAMGALSAALGVVTGGLGAGDISLSGLADADYGATLGKVFAETAVEQAASAPVDAASEGLSDLVENGSGTGGPSQQGQQTGTPLAPAGSGTGGPSQQDLQTVAALGRVAHDIAGLARDEQQLTQKEKANAAGVSNALQESLPGAQQGLGPILGLGGQVRQVEQQANELGGHTGALDREENTNPETAQQVGSMAAKAEKAAARDPKDIKPEELQQIVAEVRRMAPAQKRSFLRRAGSALRRLFAALLRRLSSAKGVIQRLMARIQSRIVGIVLKSTGIQEPARSYLAGMLEAQENLPKERQVLDEKETAATNMGNLAGQVEEVTRG